MALRDVTRQSLEFLNQNLRMPGIQPGSVRPARGGAAAAQDGEFRVVDEFLPVLPFVDVSGAGTTFSRQYQVIAANDLVEPQFTARGATRAWEPGATLPFGEELDTVGTRFQKLSLTVRSDTHLGAGAPDDVQEAELFLARAAVLRALGEAVLYSDPPDDDGSDLAGIPFYLPANSAQLVGYDGGRGMIGGLAEIEARCAPGGDGIGAGPDIFVVSSRARWRLLKELEDKGVMPDYRRSPLTGRLQLHFHGKPVLTGRVPEGDDPAEGSYAYAMCVTGPSAVRVLHIGGDAFGVRMEPEVSSFGLDAQGEANRATNGVEVLGIYAVLVPDPRAVALLRGVPVENPFDVP
ncbi:MAG: hypothetical protein C3F17_04905 [Bradyrhizobiaceae bacterium]|nr:MAG: hypothetical protein C3F17_04905 [Bradyrhizobiaceae bacterium]